MLYRVVLIIPDTESLSDFIAQMELPRVVNGRDCTVVGTDQSQIKVTRLPLWAYVQVLRFLQ